MVPALGRMARCSIGSAAHCAHDGALGAMISSVIKLAVGSIYQSLFVVREAGARGRFTTTRYADSTDSLTRYLHTYICIWRSFCNILFMIVWNAHIFHRYGTCSFLFMMVDDR